MLRSRRLCLATIAVWLVAGLVLAADDPVEEYCDNGGICDVYNDFETQCSDESEADYFECICLSGYIPAYQACLNCRGALGGFGGETGYYSSICSQQDLTVAPIPTSILSEQKERNETVAVPTITSSSSSTYSYNMDYTTLYQSPYTITISGVPSVTLPDIGPATQTGDDDDGASTLGARRLLAKCLVFASLATALIMMVDR